MSAKFFKEYKAYMTPLSPVHIGNDNTYDPSTFVIQDHKLYHFNPMQMDLEDDIREALTRDICGSFAEISKFLSKNATVCKVYADMVVSIDQSCEKRIRGMQAGKGRWDCFVTMRDQTARAAEAYIPGSSVKGAINTAHETALGFCLDIKDAFLSPMRFLQVSDFKSKNRQVLVGCECASRYYKKNGKPCKTKEDKNITAFFESIRPYQYRVFQGVISLSNSKNLNGIQHVYTDVQDVLRDVHSYSMGIWKKEKDLYKDADSIWTDNVDNLLGKLSSSISQGKACLIRLGKNHGAESKTIPGLAQIEIRHKSGLKEISSKTTTIWFTGNSWELDSMRGLPYGWVLLELEDAGQEETSLKSWCNSGVDSIQRVNVTKELDDLKIQRENRRVKLQARRVEKEKEAQAEQEKILRCQQEDEKVQAEREAKEREIKALKEVLSQTGLSDDDISDLVELKKHVGFLSSSDRLMGRTRTILQNAVAWTDSDAKKRLADAVEPIAQKRKMLDKNYLDKKKVREFKSLFAQLRGLESA